MLKIDKTKSKQAITNKLEKFLESWCWYDLHTHGPIPCTV